MSINRVEENYTQENLPYGRFSWFLGFNKNGFCGMVRCKKGGER